MKDFLNYLTNKNLSKLSLKNYKSDINHFTSWIVMKLRSKGSYIETLQDSFPFLSHDLVLEYINFLAENKTPIKTINRRLSTIRNLSKYLIEINIFEEDFTANILNKKHHKNSNIISLQPILEDFRSYLESENISKTTIKNYTSDIRKFITWLEKNPTYAQTT